MGHWRLGRLPQTREWIEVIGILNDGCVVEDVADKSVEASIADFRRAANDPGLVHTFWLLTQLPLSARSEDAVAYLRGAGVRVGESLDALSLLTAFGSAVDQHREALGNLTDTGELAKLAAVETLTATLMEGTASLFEASREDVQSTLKTLGSEKRFGFLARAFVGNFLQKHITYYLSREISNHVQMGKRLSDIGAHVTFREALATHCRETARIMETFAGQWFSKRAYLPEGIDREQAKKFLNVAFEKVRKELQIRATA